MDEVGPNIIVRSTIFCGAVGVSGVPATMLRSIPSLFLNDAWMYSENAVLWHGVAGMSYFVLPCL